MKDHFSSMGLSGTKLQDVEASPLDSKYMLAKVTWRIELRNPSCADHVIASATYILAPENGDAFSIILQIDHQDLATVVKELQFSQQ
jgi:hypothetical protein